MNKAPSGPTQIKSLKNNYLSLLTAAALTLFSFCAHAQYDSTRPLQPVETNGNSYRNGEFRSSLGIPLDTFKLAIKDSGRIAYKGGSMWMYNGRYWMPSSSGVVSSPGHGIDSLSYNNTTLFVWKDGVSTAIPFTRFICYNRDNFDGTKTIGYNCNDEAVDSSSNHTKWFKAGPNIVLTPYGPYGDSILFASTGGIAGGRLEGLYVTHDTLYQYNISSGSAVIGQALYTSVQSHVTLQPANGTFDRVDVIADSLGVIVVKTGVAAADPQVPQVDPAKEIVLTSITVKTGTTSPSNITHLSIWDENYGTPSESNATANAGITVNFNNTTAGTVSHLTKSADIGSSTITKNVFFTFPVTRNRNSYSALTLRVKLKAAFTASENLGVFFRYGTGSTIVGGITLNAGTGFNKSLTTYQNITIPLGSIPFTSDSISSISITVSGASAGFYLDYIELQGGVPQPAAGGISGLYRKAGKDSIYWINPATGQEAGIKDSTSAGGGSYTANAPVTLTGSAFGVDTTSGVARALVTQYQRKKTSDSLLALIVPKLNITDTSAKWVQFAGLTPGGDSLYVVKNGTLTKTKINASGSSGPPPIRTVTANTTFATSDYGILVNTSSGNITITIDPTIGNYPGYIKKISSDANTVTLSMSSGTIDGAASRILYSENETVKFQFNSTNAYILY